MEKGQQAELVWVLTEIKFANYEGFHIRGWNYSHPSPDPLAWQVPSIEDARYSLDSNVVIERAAAVLLISQRSRWAEHPTVVAALLPPSGIELRERIGKALAQVEACCLNDEADWNRVFEAIVVALQPTKTTRALLAEFKTGHPMPRSHLEALVRCLDKEFCS